ncbi:MAG: PDZ domain-containing protein [Chloroflexi bacterium]|nr:PDZ domain-containing protein [Chloroflexota bacterium]
MMHRTRSTSLLFLSIVALFLAACAGIAGTEPEIKPVSEVKVPHAAVAAEQHVPEVAPSQDAPAEIEGPMGQLFAHEQAFIELFERTSGSVVHVGVDDGQGSGFVYDDAGHIVTNNHVIAQARSIVISFADGSQLDATVVGTDPGSDLAVLKVEAGPGELKAVKLADSDQLRVGQLVVAIGSPFGLANTLTTGVISGLDRLFPGAEAPGGGRYNIPDIIQTDAAINPGNSGGPLLDLRGYVIGVNTAIESPVRGSSGVGFAVPSNVVAVVVPQLISNGSVAHPWLGISGTELNASLAETLGLDRDQRGIAIGSITAGGPADDAGIVAANQATGLGGDVITGIEEQDVKEFDDLLGYIVGQTAVGQTIDLRVLRDGKTISVPVTLGERPNS